MARAGEIEQGSGWAGRRWRLGSRSDRNGLVRWPHLFVFVVMLVALSWTAGSVIRAATGRSGRASAARFERQVGVTTVSLDHDLAKTLGLPRDSKGLVVTSTESGRASAIQAGDVIEAVNGRPVATSSAANGALRTGSGPVHLRLNRHGHIRHVRLKVAKPVDSAKLKAGSKGA